MKNKRAYSQYEKQLDSLIKNGSAPDFAVIVFDINDVTQVNDNFGYTAGDEFIKKGCYLICNTFKQSPVFHIGEDQFVALLMWGDYENRSILVERLKEIQFTYAAIYKKCFVAYFFIVFTVRFLYNYNKKIHRRI